MQKPYNNLNQLYLSTLDEVYNLYEFENNPRGFAERETLGFCGKLENPRNRFCYHPQRRQNIIFNYAEALWYLSGKNDLEFIQWYAPSMARFSADGETLPGTGYGKKLLHFGAKNLNQINRVVDILKNDDTDSKRAFLQIFSANEDIYKHNIDVSCTLGLQLLLRENKLHMVGYMRANDAYVGMLSDIFSFTFIQEFIASLLGCEVGTYTHQVGSIHIYEKNLEKVASLLQNSSQNILSEQSLPVMPRSDFNIIESVLEYEKQIRNGSMSLSDINATPLDDYWRDLLRLFKANTFIRKKSPIDAVLLNQLHPYHRLFLINRQTNKTVLCEQEGALI